jgi:hypothetical protein
MHRVDEDRDLLDDAETFSVYRLTWTQWVSIYWWVYSFFKWLGFWWSENQAKELN